MVKIKKVDFSNWSVTKRWEYLFYIFKNNTNTVDP